MNVTKKRFWSATSLIAGIVALGLTLADFKLGIFAPPPPPPSKTEKLSAAVKKTIREKVKGLVDKYWRKKDEKEDEKQQERQEERPASSYGVSGPVLYKTAVGLSILGVLSGVIAWARREDHKFIVAGVGCSLISISWDNMIFGVTVAVAFFVFGLLMKHADI